MTIGRPPGRRAAPIARPACRRCDSDFVVGDQVESAGDRSYRHADPDVCTAVLAERNRAAAELEAMRAAEPLTIPCRRCDGAISPVALHTCPDGVIP